MPDHTQRSPVKSGVWPICKKLQKWWNICNSLLVTFAAVCLAEALESRNSRDKTSSTYYSQLGRVHKGGAIALNLRLMMIFPSNRVNHKATFVVSTSHGSHFDSVREVCRAVCALCEQTASTQVASRIQRSVGKSSHIALDILSVKQLRVRRAKIQSMRQKRVFVERFSAFGHDG